MNKACFFILILWALAGQCLARGTDSLKPPFAIYIMPCQLIDGGYASGLTAGTEFRLYNRFSMTLEAGNFYTNGFMGKADAKCYLNNEFKDGKMEEKSYLAIEYAYKRQVYTANDSLKSVMKNLDYSVYKFVNILNLKIGFTATRARSYYMDAYCGIGIRYRVVNNNLTSDQIADLYHWHEGFIDNFTNSSAHGISPSISLGWKIGYRYK